MTEFCFENADVKSIHHCKQRMKSTLSVSSECVETKLCKPCISFTSLTQLELCVIGHQELNNQLLLNHNGTGVGTLIFFNGKLRVKLLSCNLLVGCLTSQQHASVSQRRICSDNFTCCHTEIQVADQTFYLTQSQYTDTGPTSPSADPIPPGAWQGSHWSANFWVTGMTRPRRKRDSNLGSSALEADALPLGQRGGPLM